MIAKKPHENAPDFVKLNLSFKVDEFSAFLQAHVKGDGWANVVVKEGKSGKWYGELDQWTKPGEQHITANEVAPKHNGNLDPEVINFDAEPESGLPF